MTISELRRYAISEAKRIRKYATNEQKERLSSLRRDFKACSPTRCVYGLMTGDCNSKEAIKLINRVDPIVVVPTQFKHNEAYSRTDFSKRIEFKALTALEEYIHLGKDQGDEVINIILRP